MANIDFLQSVDISGGLTTTGNVGIGTDSPDAKLSVTSTTINSEDIIYLKSGADNVDDYLGIAWELGVGGNGPHSAIRSFAGPSGSDARLGFLTTSDGGTTLTEGLSIAHDGKVGIGTTSPSYPLEIAQTGYGLGIKNYITSTDVANSILAGYDAAAVYLGYGYGSKEIHIGSNSTGNVKIKTTGNTIIENGNVGIGTDSPGRLLHVNSSGQTDIHLTSSNQGTASTDGMTIFLDSSGTGGLWLREAQALRFATSSSERMRIDSSGNVGIGTTSPGYKLDVSDEIRIVGGLNMTAQTGTLYGTDGALSYYSASNGVYLNGAGADGWLRLNGSGAENYRNCINIYGSAGDYMNFRTADSTRMLINSTGNVGIGTTTPGAKLDVDGGVKIGDDTDTASADKVGTMRYRTSTEYVEVDGEELITNGGFDTDSDWIKDGSWSISGGSADCDGTQTSLAYLQQNGAMTSGLRYKATYEVKSVSAGEVRLFVGNVSSEPRTSTGVYTDYITASNSSFWIRGSVNFIGSIDNISVIEVTEEDASYADMCMQIGASTYEWVNIIKNTY